MAKQYGLIVPGKDKPKPSMSVASIFNQDSDSDSEARRPTGFQKKIKRQDKVTQSKAIEQDPTIFQYDEIYDEMDKKRKESKLSRKDLDKKPKYICRLLAAAEKRKKENERRIERQVQKEREAEGDEFKDKEAFVTTAYRKKLEEMKQLEEQEKREEYLEAIGDVRKQGNLDGFYRHLYDQKVNYEDKVKTEPKDESEKDDGDSGKRSHSPTTSDEEKTDKTPVKKRRYRKRNSSDQVSDDEISQEKVETTKEHLPSKLDEDSDFSIDSSDSEDDAPKEKDIKQEKIPDQANKEILTEEQEEKPKPEVDNKKENEEEVSEKNEEVTPEKPKVDIWKKRTVGEVFDAALRRYYERKALRDL